MRLTPLIPFVVFASALAAQEPFTEEASSRGVNYFVQQINTFGCGAVFADLDNDGDPDLVVTGRIATVGTSVGIYENDGTGHFITRSLGNQLPLLDAAAGVVAGDYDADGDLDLFFTTWLDEDVLVRNDGGFSFTDVSAFAGVNLFGAGQGAVWGDVNGDTWLDLYVANRTGTNLPDPPFPPDPNPNRMFINNGDGTFTDMAATMGVDAGIDLSFQPALFDMDRDGDADLYLSNDKGASSGCGYTNRLWENDGAGNMTEISVGSGANGCIDAMCVALGDIDQNGYLDIYVTNTPPGNFLYLNQGDGTFINGSATYGVQSFAIAWGSVFWDWDNDGWLDIYVTQHAATFPPNRLYDFNGTPPATEISATVGVDDAEESFTCCTSDIDDDGDLDLLVCDRRGFYKLFINHEGQSRNWVKCRVVGEGFNTNGVGTVVDVRTGSDWRMREVTAGNSFKNMDDMTLHYGLNGEQVIDEIVVDWPGGTTRTLTGYSIKHMWTLYPPSRLGDFDNDGLVTLSDFNELRNWYANSVQEGGEVFDMNSDGSIDVLDLPAFYALYTGPQGDCNSNTFNDLQDILDGTSLDTNLNGIPDECEPILTGPTPGLANTSNTWTVTNATPGLRVTFAYALEQGNRSMPGCADVNTNLRQPAILGNDMADGSGNASLTLFLPNKAAGKTAYFQAVQLDSCQISNLVVYSFP